MSDEAQWITAKIMVNDSGEPRIFKVGNIRNQMRDRAEFTRRIVDNGFDSMDGWYPPHTILKVEFE